MILTPSEIDALDRGKRQLQQVPAHERKVLVRSQQCRKDKKIYDFAYGWLSQLERYGVTGADRRHMKNLIELLKQEIKS